jgi:pilus assembly protein CpaC
MSHKRLPVACWLRHTFVALAMLVQCAPASPNTRQPVRIYVSQGEILDLPRPASKVFVAEPTVADVQVPAANRVFVFGKKPGRTTLFALDETGATIATFQIAVAYDDGDLRRLLRSQFGDLAVILSRTPRGAVLSGVVPNAEIAEKVRSASTQFLGDHETLINQLKIGGSLQVNLRVRIAEVSRNAVKQLGVNWEAAGSVGGFTFGLSPAASGTITPPAAGSSYTVTAIVDALAQEGLLSILAEPTLTAISGQKANFLAGGEFPIPVGQSLGQISIEFHTFGVGLEFTPTVLSDRLINLQVKPEVSELSNNGSLVLNGARIPSLITRRAETTVELGSGQSLVIAGLLQNKFNTSIDMLPGIGDLPVLGALFRSTQFRKDESELVIIVTPTIVRPLSESTRIPVPTDFVGPPSDLDRILFGRLGTTRPGEGPLELPVPGPRLRGDAGFLLE